MLAPRHQTVIGLTGPGPYWPAVAAGVLATDEVTKSLVAGWAQDRSVHLVGPLIKIQVVRNGGGPFALWSPRGGVFTLVTVVGLVAILGMLRSVARARAALALAVMAGGGLGNLTDRLIRHPGGGHGQVVDWLRVAGYPHTFNLADVALRAGAVAFAVTILTRRRAGQEVGA